MDTLPAARRLVGEWRVGMLFAIPLAGTAVTEVGTLFSGQPIVRRFKLIPLPGQSVCVSGFTVGW